MSRALKSKRDSKGQLRNYEKENNYRKRPENLAKDRARHRARYKAMKAGKVKKGDSKEIDHKNMNANDNSPSNLRVVSRSTNRRKQPKTKTHRK